MKNQLYRDTLIAIVIFIIISTLVLFTGISDSIHSYEKSHNILHHALEIALIFFIALSVLGIRYAFLFYSYMKTTEKVSFVMRNKEKIQSQQNKLSSLGELAGGLAHEINNALQPILGLSEIVQRRLSENDPDNLSENVDIIVERAKYARKIVQNMLTFARKQDIEKISTSIQETIHESVDFARQYIPTTTQIDISYKDENLQKREIVVDKTAFIQVMLNLFLNAAHAMKNKGAISVEVDSAVATSKEQSLHGIRQGDYIKIDVIDQGPGIDKAILEKIFNPFFTTKQNQGGTGLGLSTCYGIIQDMDGVIYADNHSLYGAVFTIYLPLSEEGEAS